MYQRTVFGVGIGIVVLSLGIVAYTAGFGNERRFVAYVPVVDDVVDGKEVLRDAPELLTRDHLNRFVLVLMWYHENFKYSGGRLYIEKRLRDNRELLWNFTSKAEDTSLTVR